MRYQEEVWQPTALYPVNRAKPGGKEGTAPHLHIKATMVGWTILPLELMTLEEEILPQYAPVDAAVHAARVRRARAVREGEFITPQAVPKTRDIIMVGEQVQLTNADYNALRELTNPLGITFTHNAGAQVSIVEVDSAQVTVKTEVESTGMITHHQVSATALVLSGLRAIAALRMAQLN